MRKCKLHFTTIMKVLYSHLFDISHKREGMKGMKATSLPQKIPCVHELLKECMYPSYFQKFVGPLPDNNIILQTTEKTLTSSLMETMQYLIAKVLFESKVLGDEMGILGLSSCRTLCPSPTT